MPEPSFLHRLKERKLVQWALAYLAGAWVLVEATSLVVDQFRWPEIIGQAVTVLAFFGFFIVLVVAWYHGEKGRQRASGLELVIVAVVLVIAGGVVTTLPGGNGDTVSDRGPRVTAVDEHRPRIAVLPLDNHSLSPEDAYFADGMHAELTTRVSQISALFVISQASVQQFGDPATRPSVPEIAAALGGIDYLLLGDARIAGDLVRINVHLIDGKTDGHLWSDAFDGPYSVEESIEVQSQIAREIASVLQVKIRPDEDIRISAMPTEDLQAYDLFLLGQHRFYARSAENLREAIRYYEAAIRQDSTFAEAWAGLAMAWIVLPWYEPIDAREAYDLGQEAAQRALILDEGLAEVHTALGGQALYDEWDWEKAAAHLSSALELNPNYAQAYHWLSTAHRSMGLRDQAIRELQEGIRHNPLGNNFHFALANYLYDAGRVEEALAAFGRAAALEPPVAWGLLMMSVFMAQQGWIEDATTVIQRWGEVIGYPSPERLPVVLRAFENAELTAEALIVLNDVLGTTGLHDRDVVVLSLNLHSPAETLRIVQDLVAQRDVMAPSLGLAFTRAKILENPEVLAVLRDAGIPVY
jgi:TolB-like protein